MSSKKRLFHTLRLCSIRRSSGRGKYLREKKIMNYVGKDVHFMPRKVPLYPELIKLHDNVSIASKVTFITHDVVHNMLNNKYGQKEFQEKIGCIEIEENVFVGSNTTIMYDVKIGANSIIAAGSIVTKDVPRNSIVAGVPARVIGTLDDYVEKLRLSGNVYPTELAPKKLILKQELIEQMWSRFNNVRK